MGGRECFPPPKGVGDAHRIKTCPNLIFRPSYGPKNERLRSDTGLHRRWRTSSSLPARARRIWRRRRRQPSVLVRLRYVGLEGGLYALALCPFGHITNAGLAANYVRLCATVFSFTINAHKQASCELVRICILTIVALASLIKRIEPARCLVLTSKNSMCNCNVVYVIYVCGYSNDDFFGSFFLFLLLLRPKMSPELQTQKPLALLTGFPNTLQT